MRLIVLLAAIAALTLGAPRAEEPKSSFEKAQELREPTSTTVSGTVVSTSGHNLAIDTPAGNRMEFEVGSDSVLPVGMTAGTQVLVTYRPAETGVSHVIEVTRARETTPAPVGVAAATPAAAASPRAQSRGTFESQALPTEPSRRRAHLILGAVVALVVVGAIATAGIVLRKGP
jgi:hypothetical protein